MPHVYKGKRYSYKRKRKLYADGSSRKPETPCWIPKAKRVDPFAKAAEEVRAAARVKWAKLETEAKRAKAANERAVGKKYGIVGEMVTGLRAVGL